VCPFEREELRFVLPAETTKFEWMIRGQVLTLIHEVSIDSASLEARAATFPQAVSIVTGETKRLRPVVLPFLLTEYSIAKEESLAERKERASHANLAGLLLVLLL